MQIFDCEQLVLGACLVDAKAIMMLAPHLSSDRFSKAEHKVLYDVMLDVYQAKKTVDVGSVALALGQNLDKVGGIQYLTLLANKLHNSGIYSTQGLKTWANAVDQGGRVRHIGLVAAEYADKFNELNQVLTADVDVDAVIAEFMTKLRVSQGKGEGGYKPISEGFEEFEQRLKKAMAGEPTDVMATGFSGIDTMLGGGFPRGGLVVLCALSSDGKTSLALQIAHNVANLMHTHTENGILKPIPGVVLVNSFEMLHWKLAQRLACGYAEVDTHLISSGTFRDTHKNAKKLFSEIERIKQLPIKIDDSSFMTSSGISYHAAMEMSQQSVKLIVIDFAELVGGDGRGAESEELRVSGIARSAKQLAKDTGATVLLLCQYNRTVDMKPDRLGDISSIRYSGAIGHAADLVGHIYNPIQQTIRGHTIAPPENMKLVWIEPGRSGRAYFFVDKFRDGPTGTSVLKWTPAYTRFDDVERIAVKDEF